MKAYQDGRDFKEILDSIRSLCPNMALAAIDFWGKLVLLDVGDNQQNFIMKLMDQ